MVFHCVSHTKTLGSKVLVLFTMSLISSNAWRETSIRSLASILFIESESLLLTLLTVEKKF